MDRALAAAMREQGRVILGAERHRADQATGTVPAVGLQSLLQPTAVLRDAAAGVGAAELAVDEDFVVRRAVRRLEDFDFPTLGWRALEVIQTAGAGTGAETGGSSGDSVGGEWLRYAGGPLALPHVSYRSVLEPGALDLGLFRDRVVFVGALPRVGVFQERRDELRHPGSPWAEGAGFMPGVEVQATQFLNWLRGEMLHRPPVWVELVGTVVLAFGLAALAVGCRLSTGTIGAAAVSLGAAGAAAVSSHWGWWFPWVVASGVLAPTAWGAGVVYHGVDWHRQRRRLETRRKADLQRIERQAALLDRALDAIVVTDLAGRVTYANPSGQRLLGTSEANGDPPTTVAGPEFGARRAGLLESGQWIGTVETGTPTGNLRTFESRWTLIRDAAGQPEAILMIGLDVTERRRLEADFLRVQKWEAIGSLAGGTLGTPCPRAGS